MSSSFISRPGCIVVRVMSACIILLAFLIQPALGIKADRETNSSRVFVLDIDGVIGPAVADYVQKGFAAASVEKACVVIVRMDTPGGLDQSMRDIIKTILSSAIPVVSYVAPSGSRAASAGTYILYGSHLAAMAPATNLGAATPIQIGGLPGMPDPVEREEDNLPEKTKKEEVPIPQDTHKRKMINDAAAYIKALAVRNGRNGEWAEKAVRQAVSLTAEEALKQNVINIVAADIDDLVRQVNGRKVMLGNHESTIICSGAEIITFSSDWRNRLLIILGNPNIAYILMLIGIYGLIFELANPGHVLPGVIGGISILLALYSFQILPINYAGLALILLGIIFMISEAFVPSFGSLGIGGVIAFAFGSFILVNEESMRISLPLILGTAAVSLGVILWIVGNLIMIRRKKFRTGIEALIGSYGEAMEDFADQGKVWVQGESWFAETQTKIKKGERVKVVGMDGLKLSIEKVKEEN